MQGRLLPPQNGKIQGFPKKVWREEFSKSKSCGLELIEWIFEADEWEKNPFASLKGVNEIKELSKTSGVRVESVCADYFLDLPFLRTSEKERNERVRMLKFVIAQAKLL